MPTHGSGDAFMHEAIRVAIEGVQAGRGGPFGAVVVKDGQIIGRGCNQVTSTNDPTAHAEVVAIREACKRVGAFHLKGCELYAIHDAADGTITMIEKWTSAELLDRHTYGPAVTALNTAIADFVVAPPVVTTMTPIPAGTQAQGEL